MNDVQTYSNKTGITAIIVTYGDRWQYLKVLLNRLEDEKLVEDVVIIDNASMHDITTLCVEANFKKTKVFREKQNLGSAGGYKAGIEAALVLNNDIIMLFDDDVVPEPGCIETLKNEFDNIYIEGNTNIFSLIPYRDCLHSKVLKTSFLDKCNFVGLNLFTFIQRHLNFKKYLAIEKFSHEVVDCQMGTAYACLFFHKTLINKIGLPNEEFILYYDDVEFTYRILKNGGKVWLAKEALCYDVCNNYSSSLGSPPILGYLMADSDSKVFYLIRNRIYLDRFIFSRISYFYIVNAFVFLFCITTLGVFYFNTKRVKTIYHAIIAGFWGKLGMHPDYPLT